MCVCALVINKTDKHKEHKEWAGRGERNKEKGKKCLMSARCKVSAPLRDKYQLDDERGPAEVPSQNPPEQAPPHVSRFFFCFFATNGQFPLRNVAPN